MNFETFCGLDYCAKFTKTERAIEICAAKQTDLNFCLCATIRNAYIEDQIFGNILELNAIVRSYVREFFDNELKFFTIIMTLQLRMRKSLKCARILLISLN